MNGMSDTDSNLFVYNGGLPGSLAERSDLCIGDKILSMNGVVLLDLDDLNKAVSKDSSKRSMEVLRGNRVLNIEILLSKTN